MKHRRHFHLKNNFFFCIRSGAPKGLAYIEYENESSASNAVLKMNDFEFKEHKMSVSISNPPPKVNKNAKSDHGHIGLGQGRRNVLPRGYVSRIV